MFDVMEEEEKNNGGRIQDSTNGDTLSKSYSNKKNGCPSPDTPAAFSPAISFPMELGEFANDTHASTLLWPLRLQAVEKLRPIEIKYLPFNLFPPKSTYLHRSNIVMGQKVDENKVDVEDVLPAKMSNEKPKDSTNSDNLPNILSSNSNMMSDAKGSSAVPKPPPPAASNPVPTAPSSGRPAPPAPTVPSSGRTAPPPAPPSGSPIPTPISNGAGPPPPPPLGVSKALHPKKNSKLKRSMYMGTMYRLLKGKVEGYGLHVKSSEGRQPKIGRSTGGKQGLADALAEMTKRYASSYCCS